MRKINKTDKEVISLYLSKKVSDEIGATVSAALSENEVFTSIMAETNPVEYISTRIWSEFEDPFVYAADYLLEWAYYYNMFELMSNIEKETHTALASYFACYLSYITRLKNIYKVKYLIQFLNEKIIKKGNIFSQLQNVMRDKYFILIKDFHDISLYYKKLKENVTSYDDKKVFYEEVSGIARLMVDKIEKHEDIRQFIFHILS